MVSACVQKFMHAHFSLASSPSSFCCPGSIVGHRAGSTGWSLSLLWDVKGFLSMPFRFMVRPSLHHSLKSEPCAMKGAVSTPFHSIPLLSLSSSSGCPPNLEKNSFFFHQRMIFLMTNSVQIAFHKDL